MALVKLVGVLPLLAVTFEPLAPRFADGKRPEASSSVTDCVPEAMSFVLSLLEKSRPQSEVLDALGTSGAVSIATLCDAGIQLDVFAETIIFPDRKLPNNLGTPLILFLEPEDRHSGSLGHFVVVFQAAPGDWRLVDFPRGAGVVDPEKLKRRWDGKALCVGRSEAELAPMHQLIARTRLAHYLRIGGWVAFSIGLVGIVLLRLPLLRRKPLTKRPKRKTA